MSSSALMKGGKNQQSKVRKLGELDGEDIEEITLEEPVRDNMLNSSPNKNKLTTSNRIANNNMSNYTGYDLEPRLLSLPENSA